MNNYMEDVIGILVLLVVFLAGVCVGRYSLQSKLEIIEGNLNNIRQKLDKYK